MGQKVFLTGGMGFLGTTLIELLLQDKELDIEKITVLDSLMYKENSIIPLLRNPKVDLIINDVRDKELLISLLDDQDYVIPLAAMVGAPISAKYPRDAEDVNYGHIKTIVENISHSTKLLYPCTNSIFGNANEMVNEDSEKRLISLYASTKYRGEEIVLKTGGTSLRLATLCGLSWRQRKDLLCNTMILKAISDGYIIIYEKHFHRCFISVRDAGRAFIHAMKNYGSFSGKPFNTGCTKMNCTKQSLAEKIKEYIPSFVIKYDEIASDPDKRSYKVDNSRLEATNFSCLDNFDTVIPQVIKGYRVILETENYMMT